MSSRYPMGSHSTVQQPLVVKLLQKFSNIYVQEIQSHLIKPIHLF